MPTRISPEGKPRNVLGPKLRNVRESRGIKATFIIKKLQLQGWSVSSYVYTQIEAGNRILADTELLMICSILDIKLGDLD